MTSARCDPPRSLRWTWFESTFQFHMSCYVCLEAPFTPYYPLAPGRQLLAQPPPDLGFLSQQAARLQKVPVRRRLPLLAGASPRWKARSRQAPWGGAGRGSKKGTWAGQLASSRVCSVPEHVGWAGHGENCSSSPGAGVLASFLNVDVMPFNFMFLMHLSCPGRAAGDPGEVCFLGRVNVWAEGCLTFSCGAGPTQACMGRGGRSLPSCSRQETRPEEFFTSGSSNAFFFFFLIGRTAFQWFLFKRSRLSSTYRSVAWCAEGLTNSAGWIAVLP